MLRIERVYLEYARMSGEDERSHFCEDRHPQIGWTLVSGRPNDHQEYVQMRFKDERGNLIWDSGKRMERAQRMRYEGEGLPEGEEILLELTVWNVYGEQSPSYCDHLFYVGKEEWTAKWIGMRDDAEEGVVLLKKDFEIDRQVAGARLYACGIGYHKIYLDGALLDHAELDPAFTDYRKQCQYIFIPGIEKRLKAGRHTLCARIAPGWRYNPGTERLIGNIPGFSGAKQFTAMLEIEYADGSKALMETDESWLAAPDRIRRASVFDGTILDASITGAQFVQAEVLSPPGGKMRPMLIPSICEGETHDAIASWVIEGKGILMDFGSNLSGVLRVALPDDLKKGQKIRLSHAEELTLDGAPFYDTLRGAKAEDIYIASGDENDLEIWQPEFTYHGFRYAMIEGVDASFDVNRIKAIELYTKLERIGDFRCGSALVTRIHEMCVATEKGNMHSILTDCPQRDERMQWLNDATVRFEEIPYNFEVGRMFPKIVRDVMDAQREDGAIGCTAPFVYGGVPADPVCSSFLLAGVESAIHCGNEDILREAYARFCDWESCLLSNSTDSIVNYSYYGDWASPEYACVQPEDKSYPGTNSSVTPGAYMSTGYSYWNCMLLAEIARRIGREQEALSHEATAIQIRDAMLKKWYDPMNAVMASGSQGAQAFALRLGILPEADRKRAAQKMCEDLREHGWRITTGNLCTLYLLEMLSEYGYVDDAWKVMTREEYPSLGYMLQQEATTVWERFELMEDATMNSHNHPMYASVDRWLYAYIAGLRPLSDGWRSFCIAPQMPDQLQSCQASLDTVYGKICVRWFKRYGRKVLHLDVPFGCNAEVHFGEVKERVGSGFHVFYG